MKIRGRTQSILVYRFLWNVWIFVTGIISLYSTERFTIKNDSYFGQHISKISVKNRLQFNS